MRILHTADWHLGKKLDNFNRHAEQVSVLEEIIDIAKNQNIDMILIAGDIFDTFNPPVESVELFYKTIKRLSNFGKRPVIVIAGNHDSPDRIEAPDALALEDAIIFAGYPNTEVREFENSAGVKLLKKDAGFIELSLPEIKHQIRLILTPYSNHYRIKKFLGIENEEEELRRVLEEHWTKLADKYCDNEGVNLFCGHFFFSTKENTIFEEPEDEKPILHVGGAQAIYNTNLPQQMQYAALGHLHKNQAISDEPCAIWYSGSPISYSFAEADQEKYVNIVTLEPNLDAKIDKIKLEKGKKLLRKEFEDINEACSWLKANQESLIELTIKSNDYLTASERKQLHESHPNIISIIPIVKTSSSDNQIEHSVDLSKNMKELFKDYFRYKKDGQNPSEDLIKLFEELNAI